MKLILFSLFFMLSVSVYSDTMESSTYSMVFSSSISSLKTTAESDGYSMTNVVIGNTVSLTKDSQSDGVVLSFADIYFSDALDSWIRYQLSDLLVKESQYGDDIEPDQWTMDNDPYFYWIIHIDPPTMIIGYSFSLDEEPDEIIDTLNSFYQFDDNDFPDGAHIFYVKPQALTGLWGEPISISVMVDAESPQINDVMPATASLVKGEEIEVSCSVSEMYSGIDEENIEFIINDIEIKATIDPETQRVVAQSGALIDGENIVTAKISDIAGNQTVKSWSFIVDNELPEGSILINNDDGVTDNPYVTLKVEVNDEISGIDKVFFSFDGVFDAELNEPYDYAPLVEDFLLPQPDVPGTKTIYAMFKDVAGNYSITYYDSIRLLVGYPDTRIISAPESVTKDVAAEFIFESTRSGALFSYSLDGSSFSEWSNSKTSKYSSLSLGNHIFKVRAAIDLNDNGVVDLPEIDPAPAQWVWVVTDRDADEGLIEKLRKTLYFKRK